jgi:transposase
LDAITLLRGDQEARRKLSNELAETTEAAATRKLLKRLEVERKALEELGERMLARKRVLLGEVAEKILICHAIRA